MWEQADGRPQRPAQESEGKKPKPARRADAVLWVQLLLCAVLLGGFWAAKTLWPPLFGALRSAYYTAMEQPGLSLLDGERRLARFTQQTAAELWGAVRQAMAATNETARPARRANEPAPAGSSPESYVPPFALHFPLPGGGGQQTSGYGWRTDPVSGEGSEFHTGADLPAAEGTPVYAAADGVVRVARAHKSYGNYLRILHQNGDETLYAHLQYLYVRPGERVRAGQVIGASGQTGNVTGPHLHFELLHGGVRYDPTEALAAAV